MPPGRRPAALPVTGTKRCNSSPVTAAARSRASFLYEFQSTQALKIAPLRRWAGLRRAVRFFFFFLYLLKKFLPQEAPTAERGPHRQGEGRGGEVTASVGLWHPAGRWQGQGGGTLVAGRWHW